MYVHTTYCTKNTIIYALAFCMCFALSNAAVDGFATKCQYICMCGIPTSAQHGIAQHSTACQSLLCTGLVYDRSAAVRHAPQSLS